MVFHQNRRPRAAVKWRRDIGVYWGDRMFETLLIKQAIRGFVSSFSNLVSRFLLTYLCELIGEVSMRTQNCAVQRQGRRDFECARRSFRVVRNVTATFRALRHNLFRYGTSEICTVYSSLDITGSSFQTCLCIRRTPPLTCTPTRLRSLYAPCSASYVSASAHTT